jgi:hypothetical protein
MWWISVVGTQRRSTSLKVNIVCKANAKKLPELPTTPKVTENIEEAGAPVMRKILSVADEEVGWAGLSSAQR